MWVQNNFLILFLSVAIGSLTTASAWAQSNITWTPVVDTGLVPVSITVPSRYSSIDLDPVQHALNLPVGWKANVFFAGSALNKPRFMAFGPDSVLFVANMNRRNILALVDTDDDGVADETVLAATVGPNAHDVRFYRDTMFVAQESAILKLWRTNTNSYEFDQSVTLVNKTAQGGQTGGNHTTRTLVLDTVNFKLYLSVGSAGNADREPTRALVEQYDWDGANRRIYAHGIRNAVGMTLHPRTGKLWANNNGSDLQGNNIPPEWVDIVREDGFYGYPIAYHDNNYFDYTKEGYRALPPITVNDTALVESMVRPAALVTAHCAPMALVFPNEDRPGFPKHGAFMAMRGSWNRTPVASSKIVYFTFDSDADTIANAVVDFCTGFIRDTNNVSTRWARPVGIALAADGCVYISIDNGKQMILRLEPPPVTSVEDVDSQGSLRVSPNPSNGVVRFHGLPTDGSFDLRVYAADGSKVFNSTLHGEQHEIATPWPNGKYFVQVFQNGNVVSATSFVVLQ